LNAEAKTKFVNTSMHGVGHPFVQKAFKSFGFAPFIPVAEQMIPDPDFPTVKFPNPEEIGLFILLYIQA
jgi:phosphomannomutase